jgi:GAF domain-containing protein
MVDSEQMVRRQKVLADFGEFALRSGDLDAVLTEACRLAGEALGTGRAKILEIQEDGQCLGSFQKRSEANSDLKLRRHNHLKICLSYPLVASTPAHSCPYEGA